MTFDQVTIGSILHSPPTNSGIKKKHVLPKKNNIDDIPVYSASKNPENIFGWLGSDSKFRSYEKVLTWNKDGSAGKVFFRRERFIPYEKVKVLELKKTNKSNLSYEYLEKVIEITLLQEGFNFGYKCSMERVLQLRIPIPIDEQGEYDLKKQHSIVNKLKRYADIQNKILFDMENFSNAKVNYHYSEAFTKIFTVDELFNIVKGKSIYKHKYFQDHKGIYPVYSSQTSNQGIIALIDSFDHNEVCLTWTTDGIYAGTLFYRVNPFSMTTHCGALFLKEEFKPQIDLKYVYFQLKNILPDFAIGDDNKRLTKSVIKDIPISLPIENNKISIKLQNDISQKIWEIEMRKNLISETILELKKLKIKVH